jgi:hypothetical protein
VDWAAAKEQTETSSVRATRARHKEAGMGLFDTVKTKASELAADAERARKIAAAQTRTVVLQNEIRKAERELGHATFALIERGEIAHPDLEHTATALHDARRALKDKELEIAALRGEPDESDSATAAAGDAQTAPAADTAAPAAEAPPAEPPAPAKKPAARKPATTKPAAAKKSSPKAATPKPKAAAKPGAAKGAAAKNQAGSKAAPAGKPSTRRPTPDKPA